MSGPRLEWETSQIRSSPKNCTWTFCFNLVCLRNGENYWRRFRTESGDRGIWT